MASQAAKPEGFSMSVAVADCSVVTTEGVLSQ